MANVRGILMASASTTWTHRAIHSGSTFSEIPERSCPWIGRTKDCRLECRSLGSPGRKNACWLLQRWSNKVEDGHRRRKYSTLVPNGPPELRLQLCTESAGWS